MSTSSQNDKQNQNFQVSGFLFAIAGTLLFSLKSIFIKLAFMENIDTTTLVFLRMSIALPFYICVLMYALKTRPEKASKLHIQPVTRIIALGFIGYYLASYLDFESLQYISAQLERLVLFTYPIFIAIIGWIFFREKISFSVFLSMIISYVGIGFLFFNEAGMGNENLVKGMFLVGCSAILFAVYVVFSKGFIAKFGSLIFTSIAMSSAVVFIFFHFIATRDFSDLAVSPRIWLLSFLLAIFCTLIPSFCITEAINRIGAVKMSITGSFGPVFTILIAVMFLGEDFGWEQFAGLCLVIIGVSLLRPITIKK